MSGTIPLAGLTRCRPPSAFSWPTTRRPFGRPRETVLEVARDFEIVGEVHVIGEEAVEAVAEHLLPDLVVMDVKMDGNRGRRGDAADPPPRPGTLVVLVSSYRSEDVRETRRRVWGARLRPEGPLQRVDAQGTLLPAPSGRPSWERYRAPPLRGG